MVCEINEVNDWPVGKPQEQGVMNIAASFSLSKKLLGHFLALPSFVC
jgi:hypothetical protein